MEKEYWDNRWVNQQLGWDIGEISTPLKDYFDSLEDKDLKILIPGAGNCYEAEYLHAKGFKNVHVVDISEYALKSFLQRCPQFPKENALFKDFFELDQKYDLIVEQTFFCSMHPSKRLAYAEKMQSLLAEEGVLAGVMFDRSFDAGPPFGGNEDDYKEIFDPYFGNISFEPCKNSIKPRLGTELWVELRH